MSRHKSAAGEVTDEIRSHLVASVLEGDVLFNAVVRKHLGEYRAGRISLSRFCQLRNNARGNALQRRNVPEVVE